MSDIVGTHMGRLGDEARGRRSVKNARNANRVHPEGVAHSLDMPVPGANKRLLSRLFTRGNRERRGKM